MNFNVKHNTLGILDTQFLKSDKNCLNKSSFIQTYVLDSGSIANTTRKVCYGKNRKEGVSLLRTLEGLNGQAEISMKRHRDEKSSLEQIIYHLNYQRGGKEVKTTVCTSLICTKYNSRCEIFKKPN